MIFVNQKIGLSSTITEDGSAVDISGQEVYFDYWLPGNNSETPDGTIEGTIVSGPDGTVTGEMTAEQNSTAGEYMKHKARVVISGDTYRSAMTKTKIYPLGA